MMREWSYVLPTDPTSLLVRLMTAYDAQKRCTASGPIMAEWRQRWTDRIRHMVALLPSGSGIDCGTSVRDVNPARLKLACSFHHMDDNGSYDGWTEHEISVRPDFINGITITVTGRDRNEIKDYLADTYRSALSLEIPDAQILEWDRNDGYAVGGDA